MYVCYVHFRCACYVHVERSIQKLCMTIIALCVSADVCACMAHSCMDNMDDSRGVSHAACVFPHTQVISSLNSIRDSLANHALSASSPPQPGKGTSRLPPPSTLFPPTSQISPALQPSPAAPASVAGGTAHMGAKVATLIDDDTHSRCVFECVFVGVCCYALVYICVRVRANTADPLMPFRATPRAKARSYCYVLVQM